MSMTDQPPMPAAPAATVTVRPAAYPVSITGLDLPFWSMVVFFFKAIFAAIPAFIAAIIVLRVIFGFVWWGFGGWRYGMMGGW